MIDMEKAFVKLAADAVGQLLVAIGKGDEREAGLKADAFYYIYDSRKYLFADIIPEGSPIAAVERVMINILQSNTDEDCERWRRLLLAMEEIIEAQFERLSRAAAGHDVGKAVA